MNVSADKKVVRKRRSPAGGGGRRQGQLRIGDSWNAITIIAFSQNNPLKAIAEFVENSIDAKSRNISIIRGKARGETYLKIVDDGDGVPLDEEGIPDFRYVATHICDSIKRKLKKEGAAGIQGEFGIGLLSFWTVGESLTLSCCGRDKKNYHMRMSRSQPGYGITQRQSLAPFRGTELVITPLLPGLRQVNGEKIQRYLASELRDRIRQTQVKIKMVDHFLRTECLVEPRQFSGQLIHHLPPVSTQDGEVYTEVYFNSRDPQNHIGLYRCGTRVLPSLTQLDEFNAAPWTSGSLEGIIDAPFLNLTPGTRDGIIRDDRFDRFCEALNPLRERLLEFIQEQQRAQEERSSREILKTVQTALKEAMLSLPQEEYDWFQVHERRASAQFPQAAARQQTANGMPEEEEDGSMIMTVEQEADMAPAQRSFFEFPGPLRSVKVSPSTCVMNVNASRNFRAVCRDKSRRPVDQRLSFQWNILEGAGTLSNTDGVIVTLHAPAEPGLIRLGVKARQEDTACEAEAVITVTDSILPEQFMTADASRKGLPGYTLKSAPGDLWRSRYDTEHNVVVINNAHRDFVYASKERSRKLRYICRLFVKELVLANFLNMDPVGLLERMIELSLYTEESLR